MKSLSVFKCDNRLNLFYSFDHGSTKSPDKNIQLEDNITRSFILTLCNLSHKNIVSFLERILPNRIEIDKGNNIVFDLQSRNDSTSFLRNGRNTNIQNSFVLTISNHKQKISLNNKQKEKINCINKIGDDRKRYLKRIKSIWKKNQVNYLESIPDTFCIQQFEEKEILGFYELLSECRPDGWIIGDNFQILIETKIGSNKIFVPQIYRHITDDKGFGFKTCTPKQFNDLVINCTWTDVLQYFNDLENINNTEKFLISEFKEYLVMNGIVLDLSFITELKKGYKRETARKQFPFLLEKLDEKISSLNLRDFKRSNRPKSGHLWDYYGRAMLERNKNTNKMKEIVKLDPHYSIYFDQPGAGVGFTINNKTQVKKLLNEDFINYLRELQEKTDQVSLMRYYFGLINYRLIDHKKGQIKGDTRETFNMRIFLSELKNSTIPIKTVMDDMVKYFKLAKQFEFGIIVLYPNRNSNIKSEKGLKNSNINLFKNPDELLDLFTEFIKDTYHYFDNLSR
ncbi:MAG: hypothetical protein H8D45_23070 [Bacteroidetes bacterium]|nr:hypothetical protein [Bacteroidota bacterium]MBL7135868.1 hypothetical protein [Candidatus Neomarinimicrobiota bacterium]